MTGKKGIISGILKNPMLRGSAVLWVGMMAANLSNYLFHLLMGRFLGPVDYGSLAAIVSIMYYIGVPTTTITVTVMKYAAEYDAQGAPERINGFFRKLTKSLIIIGVVLFVCMAAASPLISRFLNIASTTPLLILSAMVLVTYVLPINRGVLQGLQKFGSLSLNLVLETILKLIVGISLVVLGFSVNGAVIGIVSAMFIAYALSFIPLRRILSSASVKSESIREMLKYSIPVFIALLCLNNFYSIDVILVKHFLSPVDAGYYSGLSILGKIVVFASLAIVGVMFPVVAGRHKSNQKHGKILLMTLGMITAISGTIVVCYAIAPKLLIGVLFGAKYLPVAPYLTTFGIAMLLLALSTALANYYLAINKTSCVPILVGAAVIQALLLWFYHGSLSQIVIVMIASMAALFAALAVYYFIAVRNMAGPEPEDPIAPSVAV